MGARCASARTGTTVRLGTTDLVTLRGGAVGGAVGGAAALRRAPQLHILLVTDDLSLSLIK